QGGERPLKRLIQIEAKPSTRTAAQPARAQFGGVLVHVGAPDAESVGESLSGNQSHFAALRASFPEPAAMTSAGAAGQGGLRHRESGVYRAIPLCGVSRCPSRLLSVPLTPLPARPR